MFVIKRNGKKEEAKLDKIEIRVKALCNGLKKIDPFIVAQKIINNIYDGIQTSQIDALLAETAAMLAIDHPDYGKLAGRIAVSSLHKETSTFYPTMKALNAEETLSDSFMNIVKEHHYALEKKIDYDRDFNFDYFGFKTLEKSYLLKVKNNIVERPQHMFMRVAIEIAGNNLKDIIELYDLMSQGFYTHATPTLFNAGTKFPQLSSCFLEAMEDDSINGIFNTLKDCALISKYAGGIGLHIHNIRATGSFIKGTNGVSNGIVPMIKVFNESAKYVDQGGMKRRGAWSIYLADYHADIESFLDLKKNTGKEEFRARDIFPAFWASNLFFERVKKDEDWTLFCPHECPGLADVYDDGVKNEFTKLYTKYEKEGKGRKIIKARNLMLKIIESQIETGSPYILNKDECNKKSNQKNLGTIKSSNLCSEIVEYSDKDNTAVCNLASICLPSFVVKNENKDFIFDHGKLGEVVKVAIKNLNKVIDKNFYAIEKTKTSNFKNRPVGLGVQGLADVFFKLGIAYDSKEAKQLNIDIFETMYYNALEASMEMAKIDGVYETYKGSPASEGLLQFDLWEVKPSKRFDWKKLKEEIKINGLRNSLLIACMPTASTSQIFGNTESFEGLTSNVYKRSVLSGEFVVINKYLVEELEKIKLWTPEIKEKIIKSNGSVQDISEIPQKIKDVYKTIWEISQKTIIDMSADRSPYICQSQSLNLWFAQPTIGKINSAIFYAVEKKLKTINYYIRSRPAVDAQKVSTNIENKVAVKEVVSDETKLICSLDNPQSCEACGS